MILEGKDFPFWRKKKNLVNKDSKSKNKCSLNSENINNQDNYWLNRGLIASNVSNHDGREGRWIENLERRPQIRDRDVERTQLDLNQDSLIYNRTVISSPELRYEWCFIPVSNFKTPPFTVTVWRRYHCLTISSTAMSLGCWLRGPTYSPAIGSTSSSRLDTLDTKLTSGSSLVTSTDAS